MQLIKEISPLQVLRGQWRLFSATVLGCLVFSGLVTIVLPSRYESEMKFLVKNARADLVLSPGDSSTAGPPTEVSETTVNSEIELLKGNDSLRQIVLDQKLYQPFQHDKSLPPTARQAEKATLKLQKNLVVSALRKTNIIDVTYRGRNPAEALAVLEDVREKYQAAHLLAHGAPGTEHFFSERVAQYQAALSAARSALASFHEQTHLFSMNDQQEALIGRLEAVSTQLSDVESQIQVQQSRNAESAKQLSITPERIVTQVKQTSDQLALQQLEPLLAQLQNRRIELGTKFKPTDRLVVEFDRQVANTQQEIDKLRRERMAEETSDLDPLHQSIKSDYAKTQIDLTGLRTQRVQLQRLHQLYIQQLAALDRSAITLTSLEQAVKEAQENYAAYDRRLNEIKLAEALDQDKLSNVVMIERPVASQIPVTPKLLLNLSAGLLFGIFLACGLAFFQELRNGGGPWFPDFSSSSTQHTEEPAYQVTSGD